VGTKYTRHENLNTPYDTGRLPLVFSQKGVKRRSTEIRDRTREVSFCHKKVRGESGGGGCCAGIDSNPYVSAPDGAEEELGKRGGQEAGMRIQSRYSKEKIGRMGRR